MDSSTMEEVFGSFQDKIQNACSKLALLYQYEIEHNDVVYTTKVVASIQGMLNQIRESIMYQDQDLDEQMKRIADLQQLVSEHVDHIEEQDLTHHLNLKGDFKSLKTVPPTKTLPESRQNSAKTPTRTSARTPRTKTPTVARTPARIGPNNGNSNVNTNKDTQENKEPPAQKKPVQKANKQMTTKANTANDNDNNKQSTQNGLPSLEPLTHGEFNLIPAYMVGRISLETINQFVESFNTTINKKYKFLSEFKSYNSTEADHKKYQNYKTQEFADTRNQHFCTTNDLKEFISTKNVSTMPKILICLRHCKRVKEIRGGQDAKIVRYAITS